MTEPNARAFADEIEGLLRLYSRIEEVRANRFASAVQRYFKAANAASQNILSATPKAPNPFQIMQDWTTYWVDASQRAVLYWDTLRERGDNWIAHEAAGKPPLLRFDYKTIADARKFDRPVNYALVEIVPPNGVETDPNKRPFVIIDPRAGHGPGIGGFKEDSQVGVALRAGNPVYFVIFFPEPVAGQTLADVSRAEAEFLRIVGERHPHTRKPVLIGNCQGGWASMLLGALEPDLLGPIVINGAPMSYWAGNDGENPMRYAGGVLGGLWPALFASDLGGGVFDGAYLVDNFEYLNPANTFFDKYYNLYAKIDTEPPRFLEFERWWGGFFLLDRKEIRWIVENLFVGNKLASGEAEWSDGRAFDLREIRSPIVLFASLGDNITPPQQAFNWVLDLYPTTEALKANGQVIVGLTHKSVGHLGIFVSGHIAKREHSQIVDLVDYIEHLPPGVYAMNIEETGENGQASYDVILTEIRLEDLTGHQKYGRKDEAPFEVVADVSERLARAYDKLVHPVMEATVNSASVKALRSLHPQRMQRWSVSGANPLFSGLKELAAVTRANRVNRDDDGPAARTEKFEAALISGGLDLYRDLRDAMVENMFFRFYATPSYIRERREEELREAEDQIDLRSSGMIAEALSHIRGGGRMAAAVRLGMLIIRAGTGRRRLSGIKRVRELVGGQVGLMDMPAAQAQHIIREQSYIVDFEPEQALATLPELVPELEDRRFLLDLLNRLEEKFDANAKQTALAGRIRELLSTGRISSPSRAERNATASASHQARPPKQQKGAIYGRGRRSSNR